jgi:hypothetical protein
MAGRHDRERTQPGSRAGDDVVELGSGRLAILRWRPPAILSRRPPRIAVVLLGVGLVAGLAAGYAAGSKHAANGTPRSRPRAISQGVPLANGFPLSQVGPECAAQAGHALQLGLQVMNVSTTQLTLRQVEAVLPVGGLKAVAQTWQPCGELPASSGPPDNTLPAGASTWFTVTFKVLVKCPQPLPVEFTLAYSQRGRSATVHLPGFADLGDVPYESCPTA